MKWLATGWTIGDHFSRGQVVYASLWFDQPWSKPSFLTSGYRRAETPTIDQGYEWASTLHGLVLTHGDNLYVKHCLISFGAYHISASCYIATANNRPFCRSTFNLGTWLHSNARLVLWILHVISYSDTNLQAHFCNGYRMKYEFLLLMLMAAKYNATIKKSYSWATKWFIQTVQGCVTTSLNSC